MNRRFEPGVLAALGVAVVFGAVKPLPGQTSPWLLAALLYLGFGIGLWLRRTIRRAPPVRLPVTDRWWLAAAIVSGGMVRPALLMVFVVPAAFLMMKRRRPVATALGQGQC